MQEKQFEHEKFCGLLALREFITSNRRPTIFSFHYRVEYSTENVKNGNPPGGKRA
jgi:hypothetical protein